MARQKGIPLAAKALITGEDPYPARLVRITGASWGWLPVLSLVSACGLLLMAATNAGYSGTAAWSGLLFWASFLLLVVPTGSRLVAIEPLRRERIGLVVLLALALYVFKVLQSPFAFTFSDELVHMANATAILRANHLFSPNSILPVTPYYPGLATVTAAAVHLSGLSVFASGVLVLGVARLILILALFLLYEQITHSARVAGIAAAIYTTNSNFVFYGAQFSYESLALPLALMVVFAAARRQDAEQYNYRTGLTLVALLGIGSVVVTHHLTSYFLAAVLVLWVVTTRTGLHRRCARSVGAAIRACASRAPGLTARLAVWAERPPAPRLPQPGAAGQPGLGDLAIVALAAVLAWLLLVASGTIDYLQPVLSHAVVSLVQLLLHGGGRQLFVSSAGSTAPIVERFIALAAVLVSLLALPFGLWASWRRYRGAPLAFLMAGAAIAYFGMLAFRLTPAGWETGSRAAEFLFVGLALELALAAVEVWLPWRASNTSRLGFAALLGILAMGGIIAGWQSPLRLSQPFLVDAGGQIVGPQGLAAAKWAGAQLGPGNHMAADESNGRLMLAYGDQSVRLGIFPEIGALLSADALGKAQIEALQWSHIRYVVVDRRRISWDNMQGYFFERTGSAAPALFDARAQGKFDTSAGVSRILDTGNIVIYDVGALSNAAPGSNQNALASAVAPAMTASTVPAGFFAGPLRAVLGWLLLLVLPGAAVVAAVFPQRSLGFAERLMFVPGTSLAVIILGGLILNQSPWGIQTLTWIGMLAGLTLAAGAIAWRRRKRSERMTFRHMSIGLAGTTPSLRDASFISAALVIVVAACFVARTPPSPQGLRGYTLLWMLPGQAGAASSGTSPSAAGPMRVGITSGEFTRTRYSLQVAVNQQVVRIWPAIELGPNQQWEAYLALPPESLGGATVEATLYRADSPGTVYRHVVLR
jgi:uncharacterized membrane protein